MITHSDYTGAASRPRERREPDAGSSKHGWKNLSPE